MKTDSNFNDNQLVHGSAAISSALQLYLVPILGAMFIGAVTFFYWIGAPSVNRPDSLSSLVSTENPDDLSSATGFEQGYKPLSEFADPFEWKPKPDFVPFNDIDLANKSQISQETSVATSEVTESASSLVDDNGAETEAKAQRDRQASREARAKRLEEQAAKRAAEQAAQQEYQQALALRRQRERVREIEENERLMRLQQYEMQQRQYEYELQQRQAQYNAEMYMRQAEARAREETDRKMRQYQEQMSRRLGAMGGGW